MAVLQPVGTMEPVREFPCGHALRPREALGRFGPHLVQADGYTALHRRLWPATVTDMSQAVPPQETATTMADIAAGRPRWCPSWPASANWLRATGYQIDAGQHDGAAEGGEGMDGLAKYEPGQPGGEHRLAQEADRDDGGIQVAQRPSIDQMP